MTLNSSQKTVGSSSVKTILGKTFSGSPVNACSVEPESVFKNVNLTKMRVFFTHQLYVGIPYRPYFKDLFLF